MCMLSSGSYLPAAPLADRELSPQERQRHLEAELGRAALREEEARAQAESHAGSLAASRSEAVAVREPHDIDRPSAGLVG
jgi:hypothetical protein